ncbi:uncharacterized protein MONOS_8994 [Monocercomonoides exilis]|uniref:uncharacterized protein n=1 Tax=Monocercomonoides exilis TaxID=2049356 RepID=UPI00355A16B9|nr:hypothetical protein MONOS_8994 [Monocercomonoides exilis]|eukprot:MONOS_8994.1-p1 / transcript=MONOS_8994.1 / gene=MONOS_8994 / organism=Monocercomonoides_exilis_PA203 / gene_product=unspecified product / transcript_product=unspecified product / location=Mono_scaffold00356:14573-15815(-) / protein_length=321 / sequence_SO=supercontig / SO=protein_coding / is_pseudo=false
MIEEKKMSMENALLLLKRVGYCKVLFEWFSYAFKSSLLRGRFKKMIVNEEEKNEEKNEKLLADLCECCLLLSKGIPDELTLICVPCLLKVSLKKDEDEEILKEVELALLALSNIVLSEVPKELYLNEIKEIIQYHQEHHNLTRLAYQSAWGFLIYRLDNDKSLNEVIVNELHFGREAARELEELTRNVDWKKKEEENGKRRREAKEEIALMRWIVTLKIYFLCCRLRNEEFVEILSRIVRVFRAAKENYGGFRNQCISSLKRAAGNKVVKIDDLLKSGAIDVVLERIQWPTLDDGMIFLYGIFHASPFISSHLNSEKKKI